jgi:alpha-mannosidase
MARTKIHLVANAHLDPVWLWQWEEGAGEALSTFRQAAEFCERYKGFVFCHNEAVLYRWVEEHEPALFRRIRRLVRSGRWHVMGGWHLQPDCNMPSGESFVRQILLGKRYFREKLGVEPLTAVNLDPFGHTRGLVQILAKSGYRNYLCCRPGEPWCVLPSDEFVWVGYDGSEVLTDRASAHYCSIGGKERARLEEWLAKNRHKDLVIHLWGIGDHGGGPSRKDIEDIERLQAERPDLELVHSTPDAYFEELSARKSSLPRWAKDLNPWAVGCYTSMVRVKQGHRRLENGLFSTEKMVASAWSQKLMPYPKDEFAEVTEDLAFTEFHDILPGSAIPAAEEAAVRRIDHGLEILARLKARAFFALASGEPKAAPAAMPIFVYNPHPFPIRTIVECEFEPWEPNYAKTDFWNPRIAAAGRDLPAQVEKEVSNLSLEWRKRVAFEAELAPSQLNRFDARLEPIAGRPGPQIREADGFVTVRTDDLVVSVNVRTGLLDRYEAAGRSFLKGGSFRPLVMLDNADPWGMKVRSFRNVAGEFRQATPEEAAAFCGSGGAGVPAVRVVEDGPVRAIVESILSYGGSRLLLRYKIPKKGAEVEIEVRVFWAEKDRMLKLALPSELQAPRFMGEVAFGAEELPSDGDEAVAQKWLALVSDEDGAAFTVVNDCVHGSDFCCGELRLSLLRSPAYSADTWEGRLAVAEDRFIPRQDQGERRFHFWINGGPLTERMERVGREALIRNETPYILPFSPAGGGKKTKAAIVLEGPAVELTALKKSQDGSDLVIRIFEPTGTPRAVGVRLPVFGARKKVRLGAFEVKTLRFSPRSRKWGEADLMERPLGKK